MTSALIWRLQSGNEPNSAQRSRAAELLGQIASPSAVEQLAKTAYHQTRLDRRGGSAYDYSNVRMAAIIGLLRMGETDQEELLAGIDLVLSELLYLWQSRDVPLLIEWLDQDVNTSAQGLAAMALGDLHMQMKLSSEERGRRAAGHRCAGHEPSSPGRWTRRPTGRLPTRWRPSICPPCARRC